MTPRLTSLLLATLLVVVPAFAGATGPDRVDRLTDLVVQAMPMHVVFEQFAAKDPQWPVQENPGALDAGQLACLRGELSTAGYRRVLREKVQAYAGHGDDVMDRSIRLLESGAAQLMGAFVIAGVEQEMTGRKVDEAEIVGAARPEVVQAFMELMTHPDNAHLRRLVGIGDAFDPGESAEENHARGEKVGGSLAVSLMLGGMGRCDIPTSVLFN
ncbi:hypothetical protein GCM10011521_12540 [Arenimonas soli]|uniref:Uncharacterized protein n=1 Tax=Arenimonas soli TaxID=2269504 RepID=A0ABQ1HHT2_9GAMM|nr:hypothetical protein [Arenimonas soli]GGA75843.1 hypothetical protein GCM10011521_12540 [Arenimonas soli]